MTKVRIHFELTRPLDEDLLKKIAAAHSLYGMALVRPAQDMRSLVVDYDASRLNPAEVEGSLRRFGLPVQSPADLPAEA